MYIILKHLKSNIEVLKQIDRISNNEGKEGRMNIGYIRVSDKSQNPDRQIEKMKVIGIEERFIFVDRQSGKDFSRPAYQSMKRVLRAGDLLYLDALDRLGRDYDGIIDEWKDMT